MRIFLAQNNNESDPVDSKAAEILEMIKGLEWRNLLDEFLEWLIVAGPKLLAALIFLFIGIKVSGWIARIAHKGMKRAKIDASLSEFLSNVFSFILKVFVFVLAANIIGVPITSFIAILGAAGLAIGLALKDGLGNFAGGVVLLLFKPLKVGDLVTIEDYHGHVKSISIFYTILESLNNEIITIPNGSVANGEVINFSTTPLIRVDALVGIGYDDDLQLARKVMLEQTAKDDRISKTPEPHVVLKELGDNSVNMELRCWAPSETFRRVEFQLLENIKLAFDENGITIPYPQRDLHFINSPDLSTES
ncbi:MAG: mechanosensitive ion channel [Verrucomicrobiales bacterium]|nr:mechanosensitive ion channel [Verrucomicrobiales bacterium]